MKEDKYDGAVPNKILTAMIVSSQVLSRIHPKWNSKQGLFKDKWRNLVGGWAVSYFEKHGKAPKAAIETLFQSWASSKVRNKSDVEFVERFLSELSGEYTTHAKGLNADYIVDVAAKHFEEAQMSKFKESLQGHLDLGELDKAKELFNSYNHFEMGIGEGIDVFQDQEALKRAFEYKREPLIVYPGAAGEFFGDSLERDGFVAVFGGYKSGKSHQLFDMAYRGALQRRRVAYFQVGDMSESQIMQRIAVRASGRPKKAGTVKIPISVSRPDDDPYAEVQFKDKIFESNLDWRQAWKSYEKIVKVKIRSDESYLKLSVHPNSSLTVKGLVAILKDWERQLGWTADIVVVDYADILSMNCYGNIDSRDRHNETWKELRSLSQTYHCLVVTATQIKMAGMSADTLDETHFSEDARKLGHVTALFGINRNKEDRNAGVCRYNWINMRDGEFTKGKCVYVANCLALGNPCVASCW